MDSKKQHSQNSEGVDLSSELAENENDLYEKREEILIQMIREAEEDGLYDLDFRKIWNQT